MKHRNQPQQHRTHQKVGIINPIRRKKRKRKDNHRDQNRLIHHRINKQQRQQLPPLSIKLNQKQRKKIQVVCIPYFRMIEKNTI